MKKEVKKKTNKRKTSKKKQFNVKKYIIIATILLIILYVVTQYFLLKKYTFDGDINFFSNYEIYVVKNIERKEVDKYLTIGSLKIKDDFKDFDVVNKDLNSINMYKIIDEDLIKQVVIVKGISYMYSLKDTQDYLNSKEVDRFFKRNNINNDLDLIEFLIKESHKENHMWTPLNDMKDNYIAKKFIEDCIPQYRKMYVIDGSVKGFVFASNDSYEVNILTDDKMNNYKLLFVSNDISDEDIDDYISTIVIK